MKNWLNKIEFLKIDNGGFSSIKCTFPKCSSFKGPGLVGIRVNTKRLCCQCRCSQMHRGTVMFPPLLLVLTKIPAFPCTSDCYRVLEREDKVEAIQSLTLPVFGMAERGGRENCLEATTLVPYGSLGKHDGCGGGNKCSGAAEPEATSVCMREVTSSGLIR